MSFITIDKLNGSSGETISTITVTEYQGLEDRIQSFKVVVDGKEVFVNVQQKAFKPSLTTNKQVIPFTQEVLSQSLQITSNCNWNITCDSWITVSQIEGSKGTTNLEISVDTIASPTENRNGSIQFYFDGQVIGSVTVKQEFEVPEGSILVMPKVIDMTNISTANINVYSNSDWTIEIENGDWIRLNKLSGNGDDTIIVYADNNIIGDISTINFYINGIKKESVELFKVDLAEDQFYIEPYNEGEKITILIGGHKGFKYYTEGEKKWVSMAGSNDTHITFSKRTYFKDLNNENKSFNSDYRIITALIFDGIPYKFKVGGKVSTLFYSEYCYAYGLFSGSQMYGDNPDFSGLMDASDLIFDVNSTYAFKSCGYLTYNKLPKIDYEKVTYFYGMFRNCKRLEKSFELPLTKLVNTNCYGEMFYDCINLTTPPELPATTLTNSCYYSMFQGCTSLVNAPQLPATTLADYCYRDMFSNCTSLVNPPLLPATTLAEACYYSMFYNCTSLKTAPPLIAETLVTYCYFGMFEYCTSLNNIIMLATNIKPFYCIYNWVSDVSSTGTFTKKQGVEIPSGNSGIPNGWTVIEVP